MCCDIRFKWLFVLFTLFKGIHGRGEPVIDKTILKKWIYDTKSFCSEVDKTLALDQKKNILLEMNSFKPASVEKVIEHITQTETNENLNELLIRGLDHYGIETNFLRISW